MSLDKMVQVGSSLWLDPAHIVGVRWIEPTAPIIVNATGEVALSGSSGYTQVLYRDGGGIFGPSTGYLTSDWPIKRVQSALGLVSADDFERAVRAGDERT